MSSSRVQELLLSGSLLLIGIGLILKGTRNRNWTPPPPKPKRNPSPKRPSLDSFKMIRLMSSDGKIFEVEEAAAFLSQTIKNLIEDGCANDVIPLPNVTSNILAMIIEYCRMHADTPNSSDLPADIIAADELRNWDSEFVDVNNPTLLNLILAANYLNISRLLNLTCQAVADMIKGKTPEELRKIFNLKNDFSPEELEEVRKENLWTFE